MKAIAIMRENDLDVCLAVIGGETDTSQKCETEEMTRLKDIRERIGLSDLVAFLGKKSQDTLPYYYSAAEAVVVPSHYESFGMVALEALACGAPVVASEVGGLAYLIQDGVTGFTVPSDDPAALAEKLTVLLENREMREQMCNNAVEFVQNYSWRRIASRIAELYESLVGEIVEKTETFL
jgi:D-inositol-3-phosphate glycosyltransferase